MRCFDLLKYSMRCLLRSNARNSGSQANLGTRGHWFDAPQVEAVII